MSPSTFPSTGVWVASPPHLPSPGNGAERQPCTWQQHPSQPLPPTSRQLGKRHAGLFWGFIWVLFTEGWSMKSAWKKKQTTTNRTKQLSPGQGYSNSSLKVGSGHPPPRHKQDSRTQPLVELGTSLFYMYKSFGSLQKSSQPASQRCCPAQGRMLPWFSPSLGELGENTQFLLFLTQKLVPSPAASPGAEGPGFSSCLQPQRRRWWGKGLGAAGRSPSGRGRVQHRRWKIKQKAAWFGCPAPLARAQLGQGHPWVPGPGS